MIAKASRAFGFGLNAVVLGLYLASLGLEPAIIGVVLSAALAGTMALTLLVALRGDHIGRRRLLVGGSVLMLIAAAIPFVGANPALLVAIGLTGMVAVNNNESIGIQTIDQAVLPQTVADRQRTAAFALYNLIAMAAGAAGAISVGPLVSLGAGLGLDEAARYAPAFAVYGLCGLASALFLVTLDRRAETGRPVERRFALHRSRSTVALLSVLFALDSVATGFIVHSYLAFWFVSRYRCGRWQPRPDLRRQQSPRRGIVPRRRVAGRTHRPHPDHGLHPHPRERVPRRHGAESNSADRGRALLRARRPVIDGHAGAAVVHHGGGRPR